MFESALFWPASIKGKSIYVLDETLLPLKKKYVKVNNVAQAVAVIRNMQTRAFGQFLVVIYTFLIELNRKKDVLLHVQEVAKQLNASRPTFPFAEVTGIIVQAAQKAHQNKMDVKQAVEHVIQGYVKAIRGRRLARVRQIAEVLDDHDVVLTHCNVSGELAMAASLAKEQGKYVHFYATETRPYAQGAKLTVWEMQEANMSVTLVPDNTVGLLMAEGYVRKVIIGSDRSAANGDIANKIGSYQIAVLAKEFGIPLYVLTQPSNKIPSGKDMPIEVRDPKEILSYAGEALFPKGTLGFYPGFDVVPAALIKKAIPIHAGV